MRTADPARPARPARSYGVATIAVALTVQLGIAMGAVETRLARDGAAPAAPSPRAATAPFRLAAPAPAPAGGTTTRRPAVPAVPARPAPAGSAPIRVSAAGLWAGTLVAEPLAVRADGTLAVPRTAGAVGWWAAGPRPGEAGAAVLVGHVDLDGRPGVFARLSRATPGTLVTVDAGAGAVTFRVTRVRQYPKDTFPADDVYAPTDARELRLITCGGRFDRRTGHYADNVVVSAVLA